MWLCGLGSDGRTDGGLSKVGLALPSFPLELNVRNSPGNILPHESQPVMVVSHLGLKIHLEVNLNLTILCYCKQAKDIST